MCSEHSFRTRAKLVTVTFGLHRDQRCIPARMLAWGVFTNGSSCGALVRLEKLELAPDLNRLPHRLTRLLPLLSRSRWCRRRTSRVNGDPAKPMNPRLHDSNKALHNHLSVQDLKCGMGTRSTQLLQQSLCPMPLLSFVQSGACIIEGITVTR